MKYSRLKNNTRVHSNKRHEKKTDRQKKRIKIIIKIFTIMKKEYLKPEAIYVDIELYNSVLENPMGTPTSEPVEGNTGVWDDAYDRLPTSKSVWDEEANKAEAEEKF